MKEFGMKINPEETDEQFDNSPFENIGVKLDKLEMDLKGAERQIGPAAGTESNFELCSNTAKHIVKEKHMEGKFKSMILIAARKIYKVRRKLSLGIT